MPNVFDPEVFDANVFDTEVESVGMLFKTGESISGVTVVRALVVTPDSIELAATAADGLSVEGSGASELTPDPASMSMWVDGTTASSDALATLPASVAPGPIFVSLDAWLISPGERFTVVRRRFRFQKDGRVTLTLEKL